MSAMISAAVVWREMRLLVVLPSEISNTTAFPLPHGAAGDQGGAKFPAMVHDLENFPPAGAGQLFVRGFHGVPRVMATA